MRNHKVNSTKSLRVARLPSNRRAETRTGTEFGLMYSSQRADGEVLIGDGTVTDLSRQGLGIRGNTGVRPGMELTLFLYLPDGQDPLFIMETRVAWSAGRRFGVHIIRMDLREQNRLRYFLTANLPHLH